MPWVPDSSWRWPVICGCLSEDAQFTMAETSRGLVPDLTGTEALVHHIGYARALEICLTGRRVGAAEAKELGIANVVVPREQLEPATGELVAALLAASREASMETKALLLRARQADRSGRAARAERAAQVRLMRGIVGGNRLRREGDDGGMDLALSAEQQELRKTVRRWVEDVVVPPAIENDRQERFPAGGARRPERPGFIGLTIPRGVRRRRGGPVLYVLTSRSWRAATRTCARSSRCTSGWSPAR